MDSKVKNTGREGGAGVVPRVARSCTHCKAAHVSCSERKPCWRCEQRGLECVLAPVKKRHRRTKLELMRDRVLELEEGRGGESRKNKRRKKSRPVEGEL